MSIVEILKWFDLLKQENPESLVLISVGILVINVIGWLTNFWFLWYRDLQTHKTKEVFSGRLDLYKKAVLPLINVKDFLDSEYGANEELQNIEKHVSSFKEQILQLRKQEYRDLLLFAPNKVIDAFNGILQYLEYDCLNRLNYKEREFDKKYLKLINQIRKDLRFKEVTIYEIVSIRELHLMLINIGISLISLVLLCQAFLQWTISKLSFGLFYSTYNKRPLKDVIKTCDQTTWILKPIIVTFVYDWQTIFLGDVDENLKNFQRRFFNDIKSKLPKHKKDITWEDFQEEIHKVQEQLNSKPESPASDIDT